MDYLFFIRLWKLKFIEWESKGCDLREAFLELPECHSVIAVELQIQIVESLALAAVDLVNPLADSGLLVEDSPVQTEEFYVHNLV